jgi:hypothetical protein
LQRGPAPSRQPAENAVCRFALDDFRFADGADELGVPQHRKAGSALAVQLRARGILVRHFAKPRMEDYLRISVGTDADCDRLVVALRELT